MSDQCGHCGSHDHYDCTPSVGSCGHELSANATGGWDCLICTLASLAAAREEIERLKAEQGYDRTGAIEASLAAERAKVAELREKFEALAQRNAPDKTDWCLLCKRGWSWVDGNAARQAAERAEVAEAKVAASKPDTAKGEA